MMLFIGILLLFLSIIHQIVVPLGYGVFTSVGLFSIPGEIFWHQFATVSIIFSTYVIYAGWMKKKAKDIDKQFSQIIEE